MEVSVGILRSFGCMGVLALAFAVAGCGGGEPAPDGGGPDAALLDGGRRDAGRPDAGPRPAVRVVPAPGGWQLLRHEVPYEIAGVGFGGDLAHLPALREAGATTLRTWSAGDADRILDAAAAQGMTVMLGLWLGHADHGFDYGDPAQVQAQLDRLRDVVREHRDHEALLLWGVGNEMELGNDTPELWAAVEGVARMVHEEDPDHPTVVVTAEMGEAHEERLRDLVPDVDIWGINAYRSGLTLADRLRERGWTGPYLLTEYGPAGGWEVGRTSWGAPMEPDGAAKAAAYEAGWNAAAADGRCLGTFAFWWGANETPLDTWFALLTPSGQLTEPTETLRRLWGGSPIADPPPRFVRFLFSADGERVAAGAPLEATLEAEDDEALTVTWVVHQDALDGGSGAGVPVRCDRTDGDSFAFAAPHAPGPYRLLGVARDPAGQATMASGRFFVEGEPSSEVTLPARVDAHFVPSGWMADAAEGGLTRTGCDRPADYCLEPCHTFTLERRTQGWAGVVWHHPVNNWDGSEPGVVFATQPVAVELTAWGAEGGETLFLYAGNEAAGEPHGALPHVVLGTEPAPYRIPLAAGTSEDVTAGVQWNAASPAAGATMTFHLRGIRWVAE
jgi:hypothetical protein